MFKSRLALVILSTVLLAACGADDVPMQQGHHRHRKWVAREKLAGYRDPTPPAPVASPIPPTTPR